MNNKDLVILVIIALMFISGCSVIQKIIYLPNVNQGNNFTADDIMNIKISMTKKQVICILGTSMIKDPFGSNVWYYILRHEDRHKLINQQVLALTFNTHDILTKINNTLISCE